jgi:pyruvate dehydrogenase E2 component (dihydrolipoamide acetyltransferase)
MSGDAVSAGPSRVAGLSAELSQFGPVEATELSRMQKLAAKHLQHNWNTIPHVTHHDEADVTDLEALRVSLGGPSSPKVTSLAFYLKAVAKVLAEFPRFNSSLDAESGRLYLKKYCNIGIAVDTARGLTVPVVRDCDRNDIYAVALQVSDLVDRARGKGLPLSDLVGGCFSISSLGKDGGLGFTPIINGREVAILGISRLVEAPVRTEACVGWRMKVPLSLSYDHRVINGADAARFMTRLRKLLAEPKGLLA